MSCSIANNERTKTVYSYAYMDSISGIFCWYGDKFSSFLANHYDCMANEADFT